tara:strand:- start:81 stop:560 length:480 start_codon:yes stop_codon:yes gene_type:complete
MLTKSICIKKISLSEKENCRVMKSVLNSWFQDPKLLNLVSPKSKYPFFFNDWKKNYKINDTETLIIKKDNWIIGQLSLNLKIKDEIHMFHLIIDPKFHRRGLATELISEAEKIALNIKKRVITLNILKSNHKAIFLCEKLGYKCNRKRSSHLNYYKEVS